MPHKVERTHQREIVALPLTFASGIPHANVGPHDSQA